MSKSPELVVVLPAGRYFIGDPCYVIPDDLWDEFCELSLDKGTAGQGTGVLQFHGHMMLAADTAFGDGTYTDQGGVEYGVDAGMLAVVPEALGNQTDEGEMKRLGNVVEFPSQFIAAACGGKFNFGGIYIDTAPVDEDDEDVDYSDV